MQRSKRYSRTSSSTARTPAASAGASQLRIEQIREMSKYLSLSRRLHEKKGRWPTRYVRCFDRDPSGILEGLFSFLWNVRNPSNPKRPDPTVVSVTIPLILVNQESESRVVHGRNSHGVVKAPRCSCWICR